MLFKFIKVNIYLFAILRRHRKMATTFKYWDDCVHPLDIEALWLNPQVRTEWLDSGETKGQKVHLSRDPDGQPFLTQTEMRAIAEIIDRRHFHSQIDVDMICAIAELESDRQVLATRYIKKTKETTLGVMQISPKICNWMYREHGYRACMVDEEKSTLYRPFVNIYFGVAYLKWLSNFEHRARGEEFIVRAFHGGTKKATHKSTNPYWKQYVSIKENLPSRKFIAQRPIMDPNSNLIPTTTTTNDIKHILWDSRASPEDMEQMWNHREVQKQWLKSRETRGQVRFCKDVDKGLYISKVELKTVAEILLSKHFNTRVIKSEFLCAAVEIISARFLNGVGSRIGLMGIDYSTAEWIYKELGYKAYKVESVEDLKKPFISMYFGAAYMIWLSEYEGRERSPQFIMKAIIYGPKNVTLEETCPTWLKFQEQLSYYESMKRQSESCNIM
ncbi:uncharacterized protein [Spinacia oleracea]|uniref:Uncharacterized protein isoform X2 n=1 Tax=Spinacia oleracea TaxID=3562 RepID=A0ABM3RDR6_SPIOL|nr:uncharacterized protein LOC110804427 isoform X2 [Spinacia oleracea]